MSANTTANRYFFTGDIVFTKPMQEEVCQSLLLNIILYILFQINEDILENFVCWSLNAYLKHHPIPKSLFVFRDGVSDDQENEVSVFTVYRDYSNHYVFIGSSGIRYHQKLRQQNNSSKGS